VETERRIGAKVDENTAAAAPDEGAEHRVRDDADQQFNSTRNHLLHDGCSHRATHARREHAICLTQARFIRDVQHDDAHIGLLEDLANRITAAVAHDVPGVVDAECVLVNEIGHVISDPRVVDIRVGCHGELAMTKRVTEIVPVELEHLTDLRDALLDSRVPLY
jgi:hypothetical protein